VLKSRWVIALVSNYQKAGITNNFDTEGKITSMNIE
jgi:hypothetical protein